jgi:outer membrane biosynthesis protein TonB
MNDTGPLAYAFGRVETDGLRRVMGWSLAVHAGAVIILFAVPRSWLVDRPPVPVSMTISLGVPGPKTTGLNPVGARPIEQVAPPPLKPESARPSAPRPEPAVASLKAAKTPPPKPAPETTAPAVAPPRPPTTGAQVTPGTSRAETGARGQTTGLAGGGGAGGVTSDIAPDFCCMEYVEEMQRRITVRWKNVQPERGTTVLTFTIRRDGSFFDLKTLQSGGSLLDYHARNSFNGLVLPPLPPEYKEETLKVRLTFPYVR